MEEFGGKPQRSSVHQFRRCDSDILFQGVAEAQKHNRKSFRPAIAGRGHECGFQGTV